MPSVALQSFSWERMTAAVEDVRKRALRAAAALRAAGVPHVFVGGHAVAAWVARVDAEAVRNCKDVDILLRREDFDRVVTTLESVGFLHQRSSGGVELFIDGPAGSVRSAIHVVFAGERTRPAHLLPAPDVSECESGRDFPVPTLEALVRMKLTAFRLEDRVHILDLLEVDLIDDTWSTRLPPELATRFREVIDAQASEA